MPIYAIVCIVEGNNKNLGLEIDRRSEGL